jgi:hypothetical protein
MTEQDYDSRAAAVLAEIADRLLGGQKDWEALDRLQRALANEKPTLTERLESNLDKVIKSSQVVDPKRYTEWVSSFDNPITTINTSSALYRYIDPPRGKA